MFEIICEKCENSGINACCPGNSSPITILLVKIYEIHVNPVTYAHANACQTQKHVLRTYFNAQIFETHMLKVESVTVIPRFEV